jgi:hypothetical protein
MSTSQPIINGRPDFILPSVEHFRRNVPDAIIFTIKRTLRERWRQIVTEGTRGLGFFLATIDEGIAVRDLEAMLQSRIYIVVPSRIKTLCPDYEAAVNVITFEHFFQFYLDPAMQRWRAAGVIVRSRLGFVLKRRLHQDSIERQPRLPGSLSTRAAGEARKGLTKKPI